MSDLDEWLPPDYADTEAGHGGHVFHNGQWWTPAEIRAYARELLALVGEKYTRLQPLGQRGTSSPTRRRTGNEVSLSGRV